MDIHNQPTELALSKLFYQKSHISIQSILIKYRYKTFPISSALSRYSRILLIKRALKIDLFFCLTIFKWSLTSTILLLSHGINVPDLYFMSSWVISTLASDSGVHLGKVRWNTIWTVGWALSPSFIFGQYQAFCVLIFLSGLVPLCSWIHFAFFLHKALPFPQTTFLCWESQPKPCLSMNHFSSKLLSPSATSLLYLRYKLDKVQSFITSLIYLEPGLRHNMPLHHA